MTILLDFLLYWYLTGAVATVITVIEALKTRTDCAEWEHDGETVIIGAVRPAGRYWDRPWQQEVWAALEAVDLHRKEA